MSTVHSSAWLALLLMAITPALALSAEPPPPSVDEVLATLDDLYRSTSSIARMDITVTGPRTTRTMRVRAWTKGEEHALIVIEAPPREAGISTLRVKDNLWNYLPRVSRTVRVPASMMLGSWMGTDFTNDDLVKESSYRKDFDARLEGRSQDPPGWVLRLDAKPGVVGRWARLTVLVADDRLPMRMDFFDRKGRLARVMRFDDVQEMGKRRIPTRMTMTPTDVEGQRTEMRYLDVQFDVDLPGDTFSLSRLEQNR